MKKLYFFTLLSCLLCFGFGHSQDVYNGNGNTGFGNPIGSSSMSFTDDGTTITVNFTKGPGDFNDNMVMYIDNGSSGRTIIDSQINDTADSNRRAISNTGSGDLTLPAGFEATHAISISTVFGGLWGIPSTGAVGSNGLNYIATVGSPASNSTASFSFNFNWSDIGLTSSDSFSFVVTYGNPNDGGSNMFSSDEGYGTIASGNPGFNAFSITSSSTYPNGSLGINEFETINKLFVSPNPANTSFKINKSVEALKIFDLTGKLVKLFSGTFSENEEYDISNLNQGLYLIKIENNKGEFQTSKLIKL